MDWNNPHGAKADHSRPRPYDLSDPAERERLLRETLGYAQTSLHAKDGTDLKGREYAYWALREALAGGCKLTPPN